MISDILEGNKNKFSKTDTPEQIADKIEELLSKYMSGNKKD
jgi:hypothetical protein